MDSLSKPHARKNAKEIKEYPILEPLMPSRVDFQGPKLGKVPLLKCGDYNVRDPN